MSTFPFKFRTTFRRVPLFNSWNAMSSLHVPQITANTERQNATSERAWLLHIVQHFRYFMIFCHFHHISLVKDLMLQLWLIRTVAKERERVHGQFSVCRGWRPGDCWSLINVNHCFMLFRSWFFQTWCLWSFCQLHPRRRTQPESWAERPWGPKTGHFRKCETWRPTAVAKHFSGNVLEVIYQCRACGNG